MDNILTTGEYKAFFDMLRTKTGSNQQAMLDLFSEALEIIADKLMLGKMECKFISPPSQFISAQNVNVKLFKSSMGYEDAPLIRKYETGEKGKVIVSAYPIKGYRWGEDELEAMDLVCGVFFVFAGRTRLMSIAERANSMDALTTVPNHSSIMAYGGMLAARHLHPNYAVIFLNLKNFKYVNKMATSKGGDLCLKHYAHKLLDFVGEDGIFGRLGGDNFLCVIEKPRLDDFVQFAKRVVINCEMPQRTYRFVLETRMGVVNIKEQDSFADVMDYVGVAINFARLEDYGDIVYFNDEMYHAAIKAKEISATFSSAIANREFTVYYQPKVSLDDNSICGSEALVRWSVNNQIMSPTEFIPVLEKEGKVCDLDFYVFEEVCRDIRGWLDAGIEPVTVSVNFSRLHMHNKQLAGDIFAIMDKYNIDGRYIQIELTETSDYEDNEAFSAFIDILKERGISSAIDDFGTGYSSINMLRTVNVDVIKLDKSFFEGEKHITGKYEIMVRNVVNMINELGMKVIAEGVETDEQIDFLKNIGCAMIQGFYFDKPLPRDIYEERLRTRNYCRE